MIRSQRIERERLHSHAPGIGLIINMRASANQRAPGLRRLLTELISNHDHVATTASLDDLHGACRQLAAARLGIVAICGGDGTLHQTITALIDCYGDRPLPTIAILRGGAMNIVAESLGIRGDPVALLRAVLDLQRHKGAPPRIETFEHGLLQVADRHGFMFGTGVIHDFLKAYYATGNPSPVTSARLLCRAAASALVGGALAKQLCRPVHARVVVDGVTWARDHFIAIGAATVEQIGLGFRPFYRCRDRADGFALLGIETTHLGLLRELPRVRLGKPIRPHKVSDVAARAVTITPIDPHELGYMIDGDLYTCDRELTITRGPTLSFMRLA